MWCATGSCYESLNKIPEAIKCFERAEGNSDREGIALNKLANLHLGLFDFDKTAYYYKKNLDRRDAEKIEGQDIVDALLFLANYCKSKNNLKEVQGYCSRLLDYNGKEKEEAKALLREIQSAQQVALNPPSFDS